MFSSHYAQREMQLQHDASWQQNDAPHATTKSGAMAKGQAEVVASRTANAKMNRQTHGDEDWARECLFDCYNS